MKPSPSTVVFVDIPPWVAPIPDSPTLNIPSTKTLSFIENGSWTKPPKGVSKKHVTTPDTLVSIEFIPTPLELLIATILWSTEFKPFIGAITWTCDIDWFGTIACKDELSTTVLFVSLKTNKLGAEE